MTDQGFQKIGFHLYYKGVRLSRYDYDSRTRTYESIKERVKAHGGIRLSDVENNPNLHYWLWLDAENLIDHLESAYKRIAALQAQQKPLTHGEPLKPLSVVASIPVQVGSEKFTVDVPVNVEMRAVAK